MIAWTPAPFGGQDLELNKLVKIMSWKYWDAAMILHARGRSNEVWPWRDAHLPEFRFLPAKPISSLAQVQLQCQRFFMSSQEETAEKNLAVSSTLGFCDRCCLPHYWTMKLYCSLCSIDFYVSIACWWTLKWISVRGGGPLLLICIFEVNVHGSSPGTPSLLCLWERMASPAPPWGVCRGWGLRVWWGVCPSCAPSFLRTQAERRKYLWIQRGELHCNFSAGKRQCFGQHSRNSVWAFPN